MATLNISYNPYKAAFWAIVIVFGIFVLSFLKGCFTPNNTLQPTVVVKRDTVINTVRSAAPIQAPQPIIITTQQPSSGQSNTIREIVYRSDTAALMAILNQFYSKNISSQRLQLDSNGYVDLTDTTSQNKIAGRSYTYSLKIPEITNTITVTQPIIPKNQYFYGGGGSFSLDGKFQSLDAGVSLINKEGQMIQISAEMFNTRTFGGRIGYSHKF